MLVSGELLCGIISHLPARVFSAFALELCKVFGLIPSQSEVAGSLMDLRQGQRSVADYSIDFRIQASQSGWNPAAHTDTFMHRLVDYIEDELV